jgi:uncharacterized integral membrane protein
MGVLIIALVIVACIVLFSIQNSMPVTISFLFWKFQASLAIVAFLSFILGAVGAAIVIFWASIKHSKKKNTSQPSKPHGQ